MEEPGGASFEVFKDDTGAGVCVIVRCASILEIEDGELVAGAKLSSDGVRLLAGALLGCLGSEGKSIGDES